VGMPAQSAVVAIESECVVFEDGAGAGSSACVGSFLKHREELANIASRWLGVLQRALDRPDDATAVRSLREAVRAQGVPESGAITGDDADFDAFLGRLARLDFAPNRGTVFSAHQMGTLRMGADAGDHAADPRGRVRGPGCSIIPGLYAADSSTFPTAIGVNPMLAVMTMARRVARTVRAEEQARG